MRGPAKNAIASATPDWGTAALACRRLGPQAQVLVDTGHHPMGTNIEQIVALLIEEGLLGGFHFNNRKYADDDLIVGSIDPFELFRIMSEITGAGAVERIDFMIDQSHNVEGKIDAMMQSVVNIQTAYAKALLVDRDALAAEQAGATRSGRTASWSRHSRRTCGRCSRVTARRSDSKPTPWRRFARAGTRRHGRTSAGRSRSKARPSAARFRRKRRGDRTRSGCGTIAPVPCRRRRGR